MKPEELAALTRAWRGLPWETRDLFARWLAGRLADLAIDKRRRLAVQEALLDLEGGAPTQVARNVITLRRDKGYSQDELQAIVDGAEVGS